MEGAQLAIPVMEHLQKCLISEGTWAWMATAPCSPRDVQEAPTLVWPLSGEELAFHRSRNSSLVIAALRMTKGHIGSQSLKPPELFG